MRKQDQTAPPRVTESARRRREYWQEFLGAQRLDYPGIKVPTANTLGDLWFNLRGHDLWITVYAASSLGRIGVFLRGKQEFYRKIWAKRREIAAQIGAAVGWNPDHDKWSVGVTMKADPSDRQNWPRQHRWLALRLNEFIYIFKPFVAESRPSYDGVARLEEADRSTSQIRTVPPTSECA